MPKPTIDTAPSHIQRKLADQCRMYSALPSGQTCHAAGVLEAIKLANRLGYHWPAAAVPTPAHDRLAALTDPIALAEHRTSASLELQHERLCLARAHAMEKWASEPSATELAEAQQAERERLAKRDALTRRALEIMTEAEIASAAKRKQEALKKAEKELGQ